MKVTLTPKALKQYLRIPKTEKTKIKKKLVALEQGNLEGKRLSGKLSELFSLRAWPYRIIYWLNKRNKTAFIITIAHRQGVYK